MSRRMNRQFYSREFEDLAIFRRLAPFEVRGDHLACKKCGRKHFCFNHVGAVFCQRCGHPWHGTIARGVFGITRDLMESCEPDMGAFLKAFEAV